MRGYYKKNGTYVAPHTRSIPNSTRSDNYGRQDRSNSGYGGYNYQPARDADGDGVSNQSDNDDDNDGLTDDYDPNP